MPKMSYEGLVGAVIALIVVILDQAGVKNPYVLWIAFVLAFGLCLDAVLRSEWGRSKKIWGSAVVLLSFAVFGAYLLKQLHKPRIEARQQPPVSEPSVVVQHESPAAKLTVTPPRQSVAKATNTAPTLHSGNVVVPPAATITATTNAPNSAAVGINTGTVNVNPPVNPSKEVVSYDCGGARHTFVANPMNIDMTFPPAEAAAFKEMGDLANSRQYEELLKACNKQIAKKRDAEWLTPYVFRAYAEFEMGDVEKAKQSLAYYDGNKGTDFDIGACKQVSEFLRAKLK